MNAFLREITEKLCVATNFNEKNVVIINKSILQSKKTETNVSWCYSRPS